MEQERRAQWLRGVLDLCVLATLARRESYGYELASSLNAAGLGPIQGGTLYPILLRLQKTGLVTTRWLAGSSGPARKYYRLTETGSAMVRDAAVSWDRFTHDVNLILREVVAP